MALLDPDIIRTEQHADIGTLILYNRGIILDRWSRRAASEQPHARRVHHDVLLDHLTELLQKLGESLIATEAEDALKHCAPAAKHGEQRWDNGWSLPELIRDYQILRFVLTEFLEECLSRAINYREALAIGLALDDAITASVTVYVQNRDEEVAQAGQRRLEEMQRAQEQLQAHAEAMRRADEQKNEFLAVLAHELRNPLAPVRNAVHVLRLKDSPDPDVHWARDVIDRQAQRLTRMIDDLSDISRIAYGKLKLEKTSVAIDAVLRQAVEEVQTAISARKQRLEVNLPSEPAWVHGDSQRLVQVFVNLLVNAVKYTDEGGKIQLSAERQGDDLVVKVRDTGIGIPAESLQTIFEPFTQGQQPSGRGQGGLGIGLALVRKIIDLHGGRVQAFSAGAGMGSEFAVHLPALRAAAATPPSEKPVQYQSCPPLRILIVDDNRDAAQSLGFLLTRIGHSVQIAHDGPGAIELAKASPPEIAILDIGMPGMNGLELGRRMRHDLGLKRTVLIALTGYGQNQDREKTRQAGFDVHIVKPIELSHLYAVLRQHGERWADDH